MQVCNTFQLDRLPKVSPSKRSPPNCNSTAGSCCYNTVHHKHVLAISRTVAGRWVATETVLDSQPRLKAQPDANGYSPKRGIDVKSYHRRVVDS